MNPLCIHSRLSALALAAIVMTSVTSARAVEVLIPSYFYPAGANNGWPQMNAAASQVALTAILNPNSGPGMAADAGYISEVAAARQAG